MHQHVDMPGLVRNRSFFNTYYHIEGSEPGEYEFIVSGRGNEEYEKEYERLVGADVLGMMHIYYLGVKPLVDDDGEIQGTVVQQVQRINPNGHIPGWWKRKKTWKLAR